MMRLFRNTKWQWTFFAGTSAAVLMLMVYLGWWAAGLPIPERWLGWFAALVVVNAAAAYAVGLRTQRKLDQLQLAIKQAAAGNLSVRLPELRSDAFAGVHRDFNRLLASLEDKLKLLQELGEKDVLDRADAVEEAVLEERRRLARDLHDTVSQQLFALHMSASSLPLLLERNPGQAGEVIRQLIDMSAIAQRQMRGLIAQLRPLELQGRTLSEALDRWFPDYCRQNGLQGTLDVQLSGRLSEAKEHQLFLIIQEAMANVVKHANARTVRLYLGETDRQVSLLIEDDGEGFRAETIRVGSHGLSTMRERARKLGGEAEIVTKPGVGTRVRVSFPKFDPETGFADAPASEPKVKRSGESHE
jgi:NarL family two-component system sensor histidine kinase LiaS